MLLHALTLAALSTTSPAPIPDPGLVLTPAQEIDQLLPQGTFAYVELSSLDALERAARELVALFDPDQLDDVDVIELLTEQLELPGDLSGVLRDQPIGVAVAFPGDLPQPVPVFFIPFADPTAYAASYPVMDGMTPPRVAGSYVALTMGPDLGAPSPGTALTRGMAPGLVRARVDLARVIEAYRPVIDMGMDMGRMQAEDALDNPDLEMPVDLEAMLDIYFDLAEDVLESAEMLELTLQVEGTQVHWHKVFTAKAGSPLGSVKGRGKTPLSAVAGTLIPNAQIAMLGTADWTALMKQMEPFMGEMMGIYPDEYSKSYMELMSSYEPLYPLLGDAFSASGDITSEGLRLAYVYAGGEPQKAIDAMAETMKNPALAEMGVEISSLPTLREIGGGPVYEHELRYDWEKLMSAMGPDPELREASAVLSTMFGDTMRFILAPRGERLIMALGGDDDFLASAVAAGQRQAPAPKVFAHSLETLGGANPAFVMTMDIGSLVSESLPAFAAAFGEELPGNFDPVSMRIGAHFGIEGGHIWRGGFNFDVRELADLIAAIEAAD